MDYSMMDSTMDSSSMGYSGMMDYGGGYGPGMMAPKAKPQPVEVVAARRRINHVLQQLQVGVTGQTIPGKPRQPAGLLVAATENDQAAFDAWIKTVADVVTAINVDTLDDRKKFVEALQEQTLVLKTLAGIDTTAAVNGAAPLDFNAIPSMDNLGGPAMAPAANPGAAPVAGGANSAAGSVPAARGPGGQAPAGAAQPASPPGPGAQPGPGVQPPAAGAPPVAPEQPPAEPDFNDQLDTALVP